MMFKRAFIILATLALVVKSARILGVFTFPSISHQSVYQPIWKELSLRGHQVTVITPNPLKDPFLTNLTEIDVSDSYKTINYEDFSKTLNHWQIIPMVYDLASKMAECQFKEAKVKQLIEKKSRKFDVVLVELYNPIATVFAIRFNCPLIGVTSAALSYVGFTTAGIPLHPALHSDTMSTLGDDLDFLERIESVLYYVWYHFYYHYQQMPKMDEIARRYFGSDLPYLGDIEKNTSMLFMNTNPILFKARELPPNVVELGRMHIKPKKPLPKDLQIFLDSATEGVIYFSLGSNVHSSFIDVEKRKLITEVFAELPYKILWKFEDDSLIDKPKNVMTKKWLPQQDLLGHPNVKLFITQAGLQSLEEAITNGVPLLAIPFLADQFYNADRIKSLGIGLRLNFEALSKDVLKSVILEIVQNEKYKKRVLEISKMMQDEPMSGLERAVWWTEYVIRHGGAEHLKNPALKTPWIQFLLLDVIAFLTISAIVTVFLIYKTVIVTKRIIGSTFGVKQKME